MPRPAHARFVRLRRADFEAGEARDPWLWYGTALDGARQAAMIRAKKGRDFPVPPHSARPPGGAVSSSGAKKRKQKGAGGCGWDKVRRLEHGDEGGVRRNLLRRTECQRFIFAPAWRLYQIESRGMTMMFISTNQHRGFTCRTGKKIQKAQNGRQGKQSGSLGRWASLHGNEFSAKARPVGRTRHQQ